MRDFSLFFLTLIYSANAWCGCNSMLEKGPLTLDKLTQVEFSATEEFRPVFKSKELWALQSERRAVKARISTFEYALDDKKPGFWWMGEKEEKQTKVLSSQERQMLRQAIDILRSRKKDLEKKIEERQEIDRVRLLNLAEKLKSDSSISPWLTDFSSAMKVLTLPPRKTVALLTGNAVAQPSVERTRQIEWVVQELVSRGNYVTYDEDAKTAPIIARAAGAAGVPIGGKTIRNIYLRMKAFEHASRVLVTPDSVVGAGLRLKNQVTVVLGQSKQDSSLLKNWAIDLDEKKISLGLKYYNVPTFPTFNDTKNIFSLKNWMGELVFPRTDPITSPARDLELSDLSEEALEEALTYSHELRDGAQALAKTGGAVIFGSGGMSPYTDLIYRTSRALGEQGVPITTGGAGGAMLIANTAAFDSGTQSIGVPIVGPDRLDSEKKVYSEVQTLTFPTSGYASRIPLLLKDQPLIIVAPGRSGTLQEIAAALIQFAAESSPSALIVLLGADYYDGLLKYLRRLPLPEHILSRVVLAGSAEDVLKIAKDACTDGSIDSEAFFREPPPKPRNSRTSFPIEKEEGDGSGY